MAAEVSADLNHIQDEEVLRRMWADTEDFGKKKEIRARMYKLREQRLKDFYTTGEVVTEITGRKHATTTHTESIGDQGFLTMKTKEIRDSESPTRDFNRRGNGYWSTVEEKDYSSGSREDGALVQVREESRRGEGVVVEGNTETRIATSAKDLHEKAEKSDENSSMKFEKLSSNKGYASDSVTETPGGVSRIQSAESQTSQSSKEEKISQSSSQTTKVSSSSSSKRVVSSSSTSKSSTYIITSDGQRRLVSDSELKALTGGEDLKNFQSTLRTEVKSNVADSNVREQSTQDLENQSKIHSTETKRYQDVRESNLDQSRQVKDSTISRTNVQSQQIHQSNQDHVHEIQDSRVITSNVQSHQSQKSNQDHLHEIQDSRVITSNVQSQTQQTQKTNQDHLHEVQDSRVVTSNIQSQQTQKPNQDQVHEIQDSRILTSDLQAQLSQKSDEVNKIDQMKKQTTYITCSRVDSNNIENQNQTPNKQISSTKENLVSKDTKYVQDQSLIREESRDTLNKSHRLVNESNDLIAQERIDSQLRTNDTTNHYVPKRTDSIQSSDSTQQKITEVTEKFTRNDSQNSTNQKIMTEIQKLDTYLQDQHTTPTTSEPVTPKSVTDGANWTIVSNKGGEFVYRDDTSVPGQRPKDTYEYQPREPIVKHPSSLDLPKEATDGQYVTTYQQSYNRISVDNSPSHQYFMTTLRASPISPDRLTPSPTKSSRGSLDRTSPERKVRPNSRSSQDRSSPDVNKKRSYSKGSLDRSSPDRPFRGSPTKPKEHERRGSAGSYTIEKRKDSRRKTTEITHSTLKESSPKDTSTKPKRKFSSTQQKAANKTRASTPGASPSTSPIRSKPNKDTSSGSESDISRATYNKSTSISSFKDANITTKQEVVDKSTKKVIKTVVKDEHDHNIDIKKVREREKSPEYSSEGSVSREVKRSIIKPQINTPEGSAFRPIKPTKDSTLQEDDNAKFINEEQTYSIKEVDEISTDRQDRINESEQTCTITEITDEIDNQEIESVNVNNISSPDAPRLHDVSTTVTTTKKVTSRRPSSPARKQVSPASSPDRKQPQQRPETREHPSSASPSRKDTSPKRRQPHQSPEKHSTSSPDRSIKKSPVRSPSASPERQKPSTKRRPSIPESKRSVSSSPSPTRRPLVDTRNIQTVTSRDFIREEKRVSKKSDISPVRKEPAKVRESPSRLRKPTDISSSPQRKQQPSSQGRSPDQNNKTSPNQKTKLPEPRSPNYPTKSQPRTPITSTTITTTKTRIPNDQNQSPRGSSIPRTNKPISPRNSKDKIENIDKTVRDVRRTTSLQRQNVTKSVTREHSTSVERKPTYNRTPQKEPTSPRRQATPSTPRGTKTVPTSKVQDTPSRSVSQRVTNVTTRTITTKGKETVPSTRIPDSKKSRPSSTPETVKSPKKTQTSINREFISQERTDIYDLEDENPPEEFYAEYDDSSPERKPMEDTTRPTSRDAPRKPKETKSHPVSSTTTSVKTKQTKAETLQTRKQASTKKVTKRRKSLKDKHTSSSSSSSEDEEEIIQTDDVDSVTELRRSERDVTKVSNQDLLTVVVQHPKSSRESSPGKMSGGVPFCTTSDDGESVPRYADFVSEPEDVEVFDKLKGPSGPIRLTDEPDANVPSVADRVNVFLENTKTLNDTTVRKEVTTEATKSVLKKKNIFENIARSQVTDVQPNEIIEIESATDDEVNVEESKRTLQKRDVNLPKTLPDEPNYQQPQSSEPIYRKPHTIDETNIDQLNSRSFIETEIITSEIDTNNYGSVVDYEEHTQTKVDVTEIDENEIQNKIHPDSTLRKEKPKPKDQTPAKKPFERKISGVTVDVSSKKNFFEKKVKDISESVPKTVPTKKGQNIKPKQTPTPTKTPSRTIENEEVQELTDEEFSQDFYIKSTTSSTVTSHTTDRKYISPSNTPDQNDETDSLHRYRPESTDEIIKISSKIEDTKIKSRPDRTSPERKPSRPDEPIKKSSRPDRISPERKPSQSDEPTRKSTRPDRTSPERKPLRSDEPIRKSSRPDRTSPERKPSRPDEPIRKTSRPDRTSPERKPSRPDEPIRKTSRPDRTSPERKPSRPDEPIRKTSRPDRASPERKPSRPDETIRKTSRPDRTSPERKPSRPDEPIVKTSGPDRTSPERKPFRPDEPTRKLSRPDRISPERKPSRPEEPTRTTSRPDRVSPERKPSKTEDTFRKSTRTEEILIKSTKPYEITRKPTPTSPHEITKRPTKSDEVAKKISKFEGVSKKSTQAETVTRTDSFKKTSTNTILKSHSPDKRPEEKRKPSGLTDTELQTNTTVRTETFRKGTTASSVRSQSPEKPNVENYRPRDIPESRPDSRADSHKRTSTTTSVRSQSPEKHPDELHKPREGTEILQHTQIDSNVWTDSFRKTKVASSVRSQSPDKKPRDTPEPDRDYPDSRPESRTESYLKSTISSSQRHLTQVLTDETIESNRSSSRLDDVSQDHTDYNRVTGRESYMKSTESSRKHTDKTPEESHRRPSVTDETRFEDRVTTGRESYMKSTESSRKHTDKTPEEPHRRPSVTDETRFEDRVTTGRESYMKSTESSRKHTDKTPEEPHRRPSVTDETRFEDRVTTGRESYMKSTESSRKHTDKTPEEPHRRPSVTDETRYEDRVTGRESYMKSTESSRKHTDKTPEEPHRRPSVTDETVSKKTSIRTETRIEDRVTGKFGVTLRKTPSATKVIGKPTPVRQNSKPGDVIDIESIFDLEILEEMLLKAVGYDDRRRIRAQIRVVKKSIEDERNSAVITKTHRTTTQQIKRQTSQDSSSPERRKPETSPEPRQPSSSQRRLFSSPERRTANSQDRVPTPSPERKLFSSGQRRESSYSEQRHFVSEERRYSEEQRASPERRPDSRTSPERRPDSRISPERRPDSRTSPERRPESRTSPERRPDSRTSPEGRPDSRTSPERRPDSRTSPERRPDSRTSPERRPTPSSSISPERRPTDRKPSSSKSPERKQKPSASPERRPTPTVDQKSWSGRPTSSERSPTRKTPQDKTTTNGYKESKVIYQTTTTVRSQSTKKPTATEVKEPSPTDLITSSYGVGPTDENGKPLFGLRALRRTSTNKTLLEEREEHESVLEEEEESSLFGLRALKTTETMPAESSQLRELVERHQQYVKESSTKDVQPRQKPKAKLRDSFILTQEEEVSTPVIQSPDEPNKSLSLKSIIQKNDNTGTTVRSTMESRSTVVKSHSSVSSDGKVSLHRDVIHGEVSAKNGEEPTGKVTRSSYSYQSPKDKESTPSIKSSTKTSIIGGRRSSGPKIEEITDFSTNSETNRRYSKEYTVEDEETVVERRRSSGVSVEENVKKYSSILKNSNQENIEQQRRGSGPRITEVSDTSNDREERHTFSKHTASKTTDIPDSKTVLSNFKNEESKTESSKKVISRGDSVKALQHKFQQATEAANQPPARPYPRAGLILRSNTLQQIDDQNQTSSSLKHSSVERTDSKNKFQETKETKTEESRTSPVGRTQVTSTVVQTTKVSRSEEPTSFLDNTTKVTGVQDILTRMRNADLVVEQTDTTEDAEARALLNKFLGASVILQGMEQGMRAAQHQHSSETEDLNTSTSSAALVIQAEKQRVKATSVHSTEEEIDDITDEKQLRILLDSCTDYESRRKLRARLRTIMAEQKGGADDGEESHECTESSSSQVVQKGDTLVKTEVHTRTTSSSAKLTKANSVQSPFAKFRQLERQNSAPRTYK